MILVNSNMKTALKNSQTVKKPWEIKIHNWGFQIIIIENINIPICL